MDHAIKILDSNEKVVGKMMTASYSDIAKFINKGFKVVDMATNEELTLESMDPSIGVSDGAMILND